MSVEGRTEVKSMDVKMNEGLPYPQGEVERGEIEGAIKGVKNREGSCH